MNKMTRAKETNFLREGLGAAYSEISTPHRCVVERDDASTNERSLVISGCRLLIDD